MPMKTGATSAIGMMPSLISAFSGSPQARRRPSRWPTSVAAGASVSAGASVAGAAAVSAEHPWPPAPPRRPARRCRRSCGSILRRRYRTPRRSCERGEAPRSAALFRVGERSSRFPLDSVRIPRPAEDVSHRVMIVHNPVRNSRTVVARARDAFRPCDTCPHRTAPRGFQRLRWPCVSSGVRARRAASRWPARSPPRAASGSPAASPTAGIGRWRGRSPRAAAPVSPAAWARPGCWRGPQRADGVRRRTAMVRRHGGLRAVPPLLCAACVDCVDCIGCVGCVGLRGAVGQRGVARADRPPSTGRQVQGGQSQAVSFSQKVSGGRTPGRVAPRHLSANSSPPVPPEAPPTP